VVVHCWLLTTDRFQQQLTASNNNLPLPNNN
jgi:hypothetical protein